MKAAKIVIREISPPTSTSGQNMIQRAMTCWLLKELFSRHYAFEEV